MMPETTTATETPTACPECGKPYQLRDCPACEGQGAGRNFWPHSLDDGAWTCDSCYGDARLPYCNECGTWADGQDRYERDDL